MVHPHLQASVGKKTVLRYNSAEFVARPCLRSSGASTPGSSVGPARLMDRWRRARLWCCAFLPRPPSCRTSRRTGWQPSVLSHKTTFDLPAGQGDGRDWAHPSSLWAGSPPHSEKPTSCSVSQQVPQRGLLQEHPSITAGR